MTQEDKNLLLKGLCARLPYGIICGLVEFPKLTHKIIGIQEDRILLEDYDWVEVESIKPYLRPMSNMTEEEKQEYHKIVIKSQECSFENSESVTTILNDWLLSRHFDVRGLIEKALAIEAPDGMYKTI